MSGTITRTINDVQITLQPAVPVTKGPSNLDAQFQSVAGSGFQQPILVSFARPVLEFAIDVVGPTLEGNQIVAFDINGVEISRTPVRPLFTGQFDGVSQMTVSATRERPIARVTLIPDPNDYVAYRNIRVTPASATPTPVTALPVQPIESPVTGFWYEERFAGSPSNARQFPFRPGVSQDRLRTILASRPISTRNIQSIQYGRNDRTLAPPVTIRWTRTDDLPAGLLTFNGQVDDGIIIRVNGALVVDAFKDQPATPFSGQIQVPAGRHRIEVIYYNDRENGIAIVNYSARPSVDPPAPLPPVIPPPVEPPPPPIPELRLEEIVQFTDLTINRDYIKDSLTEIQAQTLFVRNISEIYDVWLEVATVDGIVAAPQSFILEKNSTKEFQVTFDAQVLNAYPEGISQIQLPIRLTSKALIVAPEPPAPPPPPVLPPPLPPEPVPTPVPPPNRSSGGIAVGGSSFTETGLTDTGRTPLFLPDNTINAT